MTALRTRRLPRALALLLAAGTALAGAPAASPADAAPAGDIRINEVVTTGDVEDSVELYNKGTATVDISGWILKDGKNGKGDKDGSKYKIFRDRAGRGCFPGLRCP